MWLVPKDEKLTPDLLHRLVHFTLEFSRFTATLSISKLGSKPALKIESVRLRRPKDYCGAHPGPCFRNRRHMVARYLEGLDWVGFNQMLNDVLDEIHANCDVFSYNRESLTQKYFIRRGTLRRVGYPYDYRGEFAHWLQGSLEEDFEDWCGQPPPAIDPDLISDGTPGYPCYWPDEEEAYREREKTSA